MILALKKNEIKQSETKQTKARIRVTGAGAKQSGAGRGGEGPWGGVGMRGEGQVVSIYSHVSSYFLAYLFLFFLLQ